jgi:hypothetical protein
MYCRESTVNGLHKPGCNPLTAAMHKKEAATGKGTGKGKKGGKKKGGKKKKK